ncbi:MAG: DUF3300 domain-containing protein [Terriglobia bacterium]
MTPWQSNGCNSRGIRRLVPGAWLFLLFAAFAPPSFAQVPAEGGSLGPEQIQPLVAPIALYPDPLLVQILAASTYPNQIADAATWMQNNGGLGGIALANAADQQSWDPSVTALVEYPDVLSWLNLNLAWVSALGDAYYNQPDDVMDAVQALRQRAMAAGTLRSTDQMEVTVTGGVIDIEAVSPSEVYIPAYDPWVCYGTAVPPWLGFHLWPGVAARPGLFFGAGLNIGLFARFKWGWQQWRPDWRGHHINFHGRQWTSQSATFYHRPQAPAAPAAPSGRAHQRNPSVASPAARPPAARPPAARPPETSHPAGPSVSPRPAPRSTPKQLRGFAPQPTPPADLRASAFTGYNTNANAAGNRARGQQSMGSAPAPMRAPTPAPKPAAKPAPKPARKPGGHGGGGNE